MSTYTFGRDRRRITSKEYSVYGMGILLIVLGAFLYIWPNVKLFYLNKEFSRLNNERDKLFQHNSLLRIELESLKSFDEIEMEAVKRGFRAPRIGELVYVVVD